jgi:hypothetical protein
MRFRIHRYVAAPTFEILKSDIASCSGKIQKLNPYWTSKNLYIIVRFYNTYGGIFKIMVLGQNSYLDFLSFDRFNCGKALVAQFSQIAMHI